MEPQRQASPRGAVDPVGNGLKPAIAGLPAPAAETPPTRITLGPEGRDIRLSGELTEGAAERLGRLLDGHRRVERIHLTSEGGLVDEGAAIGALIAEHGLVTYVPDYCVSACTLAFVRGRERLVLANSRLGFHAPYETGPFGVEIAADSAPERAAYLAAGLKPAFVDAALGVGSDDLMIPDAPTLIEVGVATGIVDAYRFPDSTLDDGGGLERARAAILHGVPLLDDVEAVAPGTVAALAAWYLDGYGGGRSEGEAIDGVRRKAARAVARSLGGAGPAALADLGRLMLQALQRPSLEGERICAAAGEGVGTLLTRARIGERELAAARVILSRAFRVGAAAPDPFPDPTALTPGRPSLAGDPDCTALRRALSAALARPLPEAARALPSLLFPDSPARPRPALEASARPR